MAVKNREPYYLSIWGDTVDFRDFLCGLLIGVAFGAVCADGGLAYLKTYHSGLSKGALMGAALMIGAVGSIVAGALSAFLFKPKRKISEENLTIEFKNLEEEFGVNLEEEAELLKTAPPEIIEELKGLNLYTLFATPAASKEKTSPPTTP